MIQPCCGHSICYCSVYANGDDINPPKRISLPRRVLPDVDEVMEVINKHVTLVSGAARL